MKIILIFIIAAFIGISHLNAQTYGRGVLTNNGTCTATGTNGNCTDTYIGSAAGAANCGLSNTFIGDHAGFSNGTDSNNVAVGYRALYSQAGNTCASGVGFNTYNVALGNGALYSNSPSTTTNGYTNTAIGHNAIYSSVTGRHLTGCGYQALFANTGDDNAALGLQSLYSNTSGSANTATGTYSAYHTTTGGDNVYVGYQAGYFNTVGGNNTAVGELAGSARSSLSFCTFLGYNADASANSLSNSMALGNSSSVGASNTIVLGDGSVTTLRCNTQTILALASDRRVKKNIKANVPGLAFINLLRPVTYNADIHKANEIMGYRMKRDSAGNATTEVDTVYWEEKYAGEKTLCTGLIAQEVDSAAQQIGYDFQGIYRPKSSKDIYGLDYTKLVMPLINAVQELSKTVDSLKTANSSLRRGNSGGNDERSKQDITLTMLDEISISEARPNPNDGKAEIDYYLPTSVMNAEMIFSDMLGRVINRAKLMPGYGTVAVDTQGLPSGTYTYSLIADGKVIDTKKMIRNK